MEAQIAFSTFLHMKWQESVIKRLDKYLTFPQWLQTLHGQPHQLEDCDRVEDVPHYQTMSFVGFEWLSRDEWGFGSALTTGNEYTAFDLYCGIFTLVWMCSNVDN